MEPGLVIVIKKLEEKSYHCQVFVCMNERDPEHPRGSCLHRGSDRIFRTLKEGIREAGLKGRIRVSTTGCLDQCEQGPAVVVYPDRTWWQLETEADATTWLAALIQDKTRSD